MLTSKRILTLGIMLIIFFTGAFSIEIKALSPLDLENGVDPKTIFRWSVDQEDNYRYKVYVSENPFVLEKDLKVSNLIAKFFTGEILRPDTTYYWKVVALKENEVYESPIFRFSTRSLNNGDISWLHFAEYDQMLFFNNMMVGRKGDRVDILSENKNILYSKIFNEKITGLYALDRLYIVLENMVVRIEPDLKENTEEIEEKVKAIAGRVYYSDKYLYILSTSGKFNRLCFEPIKKVLFLNDFFYILSDKKVYMYEPMKGQVTQKDFEDDLCDMVLSTYQDRIVVMGKNGLYTLDMKLNLKNKYIFQIDMERKIYPFFDKIAMISGKNRLTFFDSDLKWTQENMFDEDIYYFIPINPTAYMLAGNYIKTFDTQGGLLWTYSSLNPVQLISEPQYAEKGILAGIKDFVSRYIIFYEKMDAAIINNPVYKPLPKVIIPKEYEPEEVQSVKTDPQPFTQPEKPVSKTEQPVEVTPQPTNTQQPTNQDIQPVQPQPKTEDTPASTHTKAQDKPTEPATSSTAPIVPINEIPQTEPTKAATPQEIKKDYTEIPNALSNYGYTIKTYENIMYIAGYEISDNNWQAKVTQIASTLEVEKEFLFGGKGTEFFKDVLITKDASEVISITAIGDTTSVGYSGDAYLVSFLPDGTVLYESNYGDLGRDNGVKIKEVDKNGYAIIGNYYVNNKLSDIFVSRYSKDGTRIWLSTFGGKNIEMAVDCEVTPDQGLLITGATKSFGYGKYDVYAIKVDFYGREKWTNTFGDDKDNLPVGIITFSNKKYILYETKEELRKNSHNIVEVDHEKGFKLSFKYIPDYEENLLGFSNLGGTVYAYGYRIVKGKKAGLIYTLDMKNSLFTDPKVFEMDGDFEITSMTVLTNDVYALGNLNNKKLSMILMNINKK